MQPGRYTLLIALVVGGVACAVNQWISRPPPVEPASAPASRFSAERAFAVLSDLLADGVPHPLGSEANHRVRHRIEDYLDEHGIHHELQSTWGCAVRFNRCAFVQNVIATVPGTRPDAPYVALMAHYDSVPMAPGAGDDGSGVATVLESARTLASEGPRRNPLLVVITDGEEAGLLGAEAFFGRHPLAGDVGVVVNVEGAGTTGGSLVLRTAGASGALMDLYRRTAAFPNANSFADEVFKRMPNDTDFSVSMRAGIPGVDFAFAGEFTHYHTPNDNLRNLDKRSLQHHGDNVLPLARALLDTDLDTLRAGTPAVYLQVMGIWLGWPAWVSWVLIAVSGVLLAVVAVRTRSPGRPGWVRHLLGPLSPVLVLLGAVAAGLGAFKVVDVWQGTTVSWPAVLWPWRLILFGAPMVGGLAAAAVVNRFVAFSSSLAYSFGAWILLAVLLALVMPGGAGLVLVPLVFALVLIGCATFVEHRGTRTILVAAAFAVAATQAVGIALPLEQSQGYRMAPAIFPFIALFLILLTPLVRGRAAGIAIGVCASVTAIGVAGAALTPLYSQWRPQHVNVQFFQNADTGEAWWALTGPNPPPEALLKTKDFELRDEAVYPWSSDFTVDIAAPASGPGWKGPGVSTVTDTVDGGNRTLVLELTPTRASHTMTLVIPRSARPERFTVEGVELEPVLIQRPVYRDHYMLQVMGMGDKPVHVTLALASTGPVEAWAADASAALPEGAAPILEARPPLATPVHTADNAVVYRKITL